MANKTTKTDINNAIANSMGELRFSKDRRGLGGYMKFLAQTAAGKESRSNVESPEVSPKQAKRILADIKKNAPEFYGKYHPERWRDYDPRTGAGGRTEDAKKFYGERVRLNIEQSYPAGQPIMGGRGMTGADYGDPSGWKYTGQEFLDETLLEPGGTSYDVTPKEKAEIYESKELFQRGDMDWSTSNKRYSVLHTKDVKGSVFKPQQVRRTAEDKIMNGFLQQDNKYKMGE